MLACGLDGMQVRGLSLGACWNVWNASWRLLRDLLSGVSVE